MGETAEALKWCGQGWEKLHRRKVKKKVGEENQKKQEKSVPAQ